MGDPDRAAGTWKAVDSVGSEEIQTIQFTGDPGLEPLRIFRQGQGRQTAEGLNPRRSDTPVTGCVTRG